jgi:DNA-binding CsgD family transcriptional regulator
VPDAPTVPIADAAAVAASSQVLLVVDDDAICIEASLGACRLLGASRDEVVGRELGELLEPASRERLASHWPAAQRNGGRAGTFTLAPPASVEVSATVTPQLLPSRHLVALESALDPDSNGNGNGHANGNGNGRFAHPATGRGPTVREREVLEMLANGATDDQIAASLTLSPATVQSHVRNAKAKLGARTRAQAVALALQRGLIGTSSPT